MALKSFAKLIPAYLAALVLVFSLRWAGIVICVIMFSLLVTHTRVFHDFRVPSYRFWVYGQLIVPYVALLAFLPFGSMLLNSGLSADLAAMPWIKLPADKVILALANHPDADPGMSQEVFADKSYRRSYIPYYPSIHASILVALVWFSIALVNIFVMSASPEIPRGLEKIKRTERVYLSSYYLALFCVLVVFALCIQWKGAFLAASLGLANYNPLMGTQLLLVILNSLLGLSRVGTIILRQH
ncbi:MAG: hypothetical protein KBF54_10175 [Rhizobiales bacterium]|nr:hypothetical protein [Hyphomicrobiales bacterium]